MKYIRKIIEPIAALVLAGLILYWACKLATHLVSLQH